MDEAGVGPLAGPVVAAAVIWRAEARVPGIDDSKKLSEAARDRLAPLIREAALAWAVGQASVEEIFDLNIYQAGLLAMRRAFDGLSVRPDALLIDARRLPALDLPQESIIKGDQKSLSIAAASILAKTTRDAIMLELDGEFPGYGFARHKGYPTSVHLEALRRLGACAAHRRGYGPVKAVL